MNYDKYEFYNLKSIIHQTIITINHYIKTQILKSWKKQDKYLELNNDIYNQMIIYKIE